MLQGRTVTIKLKNVNFEVKTRASTVSSVVSTAEEIFAVAKELLRTEIDADFPHPLRLRLMGMTFLYLFFLKSARLFHRINLGNILTSILFLKPV